jgi:uracil-DNA glycosylase family 4
MTTVAAVTAKTPKRAAASAAVPIVPVNSPQWRLRLGALTDCAKCTLYHPEQEQAKPIYGGGNLQAQLVLVGDASFKNERFQNRVFGGQGGMLLDIVLKELDLTRDDIYCTNALMCVPDFGVPPTVSDVACCSTRLHKELHGLPNKRVIMLMGNNAIKAVTGQKGSISSHSGRVEWSEEFGCHLITCYHPSTAYRQPDFYPDLKWAMHKALQLIQLPTLEPLSVKETTYIVERSVDNAIARLRWMLTLEDEVISCDIESEDVDWQHSPMLEIGFSWKEGTAYILPTHIFNDKTVQPYLKAVMESPVIKWVWHNGKFDVKFFRHQLHMYARVDADTMLLHFLLDERTNSNSAQGQGGSVGGVHDLKSLSQRLCGAPIWDDGIKKYLRNTKERRAKFSDIPAPIRHKYHAYDCDYTRRLYFALLQAHADEQAAEPTKEGYHTPLWCHNHHLARASNVLADAEMYGTYIDMEYHRQLDTDMRMHMSQLQEEIQELVEQYDKQHIVGTLNLRSPRQVAAMMYDVLQLPIVAEDKSRSTAAEVLRVFEHKHPFIDALLAFRDDEHKHKTYVAGYDKRVDEYGRVHPSFFLHGAGTGRISCRDPNVQNIPRGSRIRGMFAAPDGYIWIIADYSQLEMRTAAWYSEDPILLEDLRGDLHWSVAQNVFPVQIAQIQQAHAMEQLEAILRSVDVLTEVRMQHSHKRFEPEQLRQAMLDHLRYQTKYVSFGILYGRGPKSLAEGQLHCTVEEAKIYVQNFHRKYARLSKFLADLRRQAHEQGYVETPLGRRRRFPLITRENMGSVDCQAVNAPIQGLASDLNLDAFMRASDIFKAEDLGHVLFPVHDSISCEVPIAKLGRATEVLHDCMENVPVASPHVKFEIKLEYGARWDDTTYMSDLVKDTIRPYVAPDLYERFLQETAPIDKYKTVVKIAKSYAPGLVIRHSMPYYDIAA